MNFTGRDLRFHPADVETAITLSPTAVETYNAQGFVSGLDVFDRDEATAVRGYIDGLLDSVLQADDHRNSYSINSYHPVCAGLWDLVTEPRITALVRDVLGPEAVCWGTHLFAKFPHDGKEVPFHQDAVYWPFTPTKTTTVWLAIDDVGADNAPLQFVPGSHLEGPISHQLLDLDGTRVLSRRATGMETRTGRAFNELRAGQVSLHSDLLLHGSDANTSDRRRAGLTLRYAAAEVRLIDGYDEWRQAAVHVLDGDPSGFWNDRPRPDGERPELMAELWGDFDGQSVDAG
ncbi:MAG: Phytanoyl-CoA dioxygenase [Actinomycetia bacterium]|nr:Phytanoyl-CoA dioxygenase [Actinomycetes bacterium]